jgi:acyl transferase domain-containing protein/acyl carrier protein
MAVIGLSFEETERAVAGYEDRLSIAVSSSPTSTVIAGETDALHEVIQALKSDGVFCQPVKVDVASHSPQMDALREDLLGALVGINPRPPSVRVYSTVTGDAANDPAFDAEYWAANLRKPVLFSGAIKDLLESGYEIFLELSPHPVLSGPIQQTLQHSGREARVLPSLRHDEDGRTVMLGSLGALYTAGCSIQWDRLYSKNRQLVQLPPYAWQRERYWLGPEEKPNNRPGRVNAPRHLLSAPCLRPATDAGAHYWEFDLSIEAFPFLKDHCIQGTAVLPAAAYLEMAITAGRSVFPDGDLILEQVQFKKPLILSEGLQRVQLVISSQEAGNATFEFFSREKGQQEDSWGLNAMGAMRAARHEPAAMRLWIQTIKSRCRDDISQAQHYESLAKRGLQYGPCFRGVEKLGRGNGEAIAEIALPQTLAQEAGIYCFHPALLDSCFQVLAATLSDLHTHTYLPVGLKGLRIHNPPGQDVISYATLLHRTRRDSEVLTGDILVLDQRGQVILEARALTMKRMGEEVQEKQRVERLLYGLEWVSSNRPQLYGSGRHTSAWMVFTDGGGVGERLVEILESNGESCVTVSAGESYAELGPGRYQINAASFHDYVRLLSEALSSQGRHFSGVVHLWGLNSPEASVLTSDSLEDSHTSGVCSAHLLAKALAGARQSDSPRLWLVTRAAQSVTGEECLSIAQSPLWGLGKVISQEHPNLRCSLVDLGAASDQETLSLSLELSQDGREDQVALRGEERYVARLVRLSAPDPALSKKEALAEDQPFCLDITMPGILDSLTLRETARRNPGPGEIEIQVHALGLNFRDIMLAMGVLPSAPEVKEDFGWECAGKVVGVGDGVEEFKVGDDVLAIAHPSLRAYVTTPACLALHKPASLSYEQAATIPLAWLTAHYSLNRLGRLRSGERVLIQAASGGVGLAAVRIAQHLRAEIFATAGSDEKRRFLKTLGIRHVFDSRSLNFVDEIMKVTNGDGVDVVLNSLAGEAIPAGLSVLRAGGRFLELGRQDIYKNSKLGLSPFQNNLAFFAIDLAHLIRQNPPHMGSLLREAIDLFEKSSGSPLPLQSFSIADVAESFRLMARAGQVGKVALRVHGERVSVATSAQEGFALCPNATYLITGGLGGLGLSVARWMIEQGARHLVLIGRTDGSRSAQEAVDTMRRTADVLVLKADVSSYQQISGVMDRLGQSMPPLKGVVHAAGLLDDGMMLQLDRARFDTVMAPKVAGAWNLHLLTLNAPLDFFVLFSSAAALLGSPGQGNYSAANAFLDCLAHYRRSNGLPALSINWGPWSEVGLAAEGGRGERLARRGISSISPSEGAKLFAHLLKSCASPQAAAMDFDFRQWSQCYPTAAASPLFTEIASRSDINRPDARAKESGLTRDALLAADQAERGELLKSYMNAVAARVLGFAKSGPHKLDANQPMNRLGMDSLMALEMKTRIEADLGIKIPVVDFLKGTSIAQLAKSATDQLSISSAVINTCVAKAAARQWEELII